MGSVIDYEIKITLDFSVEEFSENKNIINEATERKGIKLYSPIDIYTKNGRIYFKIGYFKDWKYTEKEIKEKQLN